MRLFEVAFDQASSIKNTAKAQHCIPVLSEARQHLKLADLAWAKQQNINTTRPLTLYETCDLSEMFQIWIE